MFESFTLYGALAMLTVLLALAAAALLLGQRHRRAALAGARIESVERLAAELRAYEALVRQGAPTADWSDESVELVRERLEACRTLQKASLPELGAEMVAVLASQGRLLDHLWRCRLLALRRPESRGPACPDAHFQELVEQHLDTLEQLRVRCGSVAASLAVPQERGEAPVPPAHQHQALPEARSY